MADVQATVTEIPILLQLSMTDDGQLLGADVTYRTVVKGPGGAVLSRSDRGPIPIDINGERELLNRIIGDVAASALASAAMAQEAVVAAENGRAELMSDFEAVRAKEIHSAGMMRQLRDQVVEMAARLDAANPEQAAANAMAQFNTPEFAQTQEMTPPRT